MILSTANEQSAEAAVALPAARLLPLCDSALTAARAYGEAARQSVAALTAPGGKIDSAKLDRHQFAAHALAWTATYVEALAQMLAWAQRLDESGKLGELERLILQAAYGEYLAQLAGGIALSQGEIARHGDMGLPHDALRALFVPTVSTLIAAGNTAVSFLTHVTRHLPLPHTRAFDHNPIATTPPNS